MVAFNRPRQRNCRRPQRSLIQACANSAHPRALRVNSPRCFRFHFCFEGRRLRWLFDTRDRASPGGPRSRRRALLAQRTGAASLLRRAIHVRAYAVSAIQHRAMAQRFSRRAAENILRRIVGKSATQKRRAAALRVAFRRFPTVLPRTVKIHAVRRGRLHRCMIGVITIGNDLLRGTANFCSQRSRAGSS